MTKPNQYPAPEIVDHLMQWAVAPIAFSIGLFMGITGEVVRNPGLIVMGAITIAEGVWILNDLSMAIRRRT